MIKNAKNFKINPDVVHDEIDGEVILLNIEKGVYYQLKNEAVQVWSEIARQKSSSTFSLAAALAKNGEYSLDDILKSISPFVDQLHAEEIILEAKRTKAQDKSMPLSQDSGKEPQNKYATPVLLKYTDMQSILLLDPIHDTDEEGWPNKKKKNP